MKRGKLLRTAVLGVGVLLSGNAVQGETLKEAIETMIQSHPEIRSLAHNRLGRDQEVRQAQADYLPKLDFIAGYGVQEIQEPEEDSLNPGVYTLSLRQNVFAGMQTVNEVARQKDRVRSAAYNLQGASENTALTTAEVYLKVLRHQELLALSEENLQTHLRISDQIQMRSDSGVASKADSDQVTGRVALAQANVIATKTNVIDAKTNYQAVVGRLPSDLQTPDSPDGMMPASMEEAEVEAIERHPTLKSAGADLDARNKQHEVAKAPYMPIIDIEVDQHWEDDLDEPGSEEDLIAMVKLRYNLFHGFRNQARRAETAELIEEAREIRNNTHRQVVESVRLSWMAYEAARERIGYLEERVTATTDTARSYTDQFNLGKRTLLDVLDTEAEVIDAKKSLVEARYDGLLAQYRVLNGLGKLVHSFDLQWPEESIVSEDERAEEAKVEEKGQANAIRKTKEVTSKVLVHPIEIGVING